MSAMSTFGAGVRKQMFGGGHLPCVRNRTGKGRRKESGGSDCGA